MKQNAIELEKFPINPRLTVKDVYIIHKNQSTVNTEFETTTLFV